MPAESPADTVREWWTRQLLDRRQDPSTENPAIARRLFRSLAQEVLCDVPLPGHGETWKRFDILLALGELDLTVARLAEAHLDALAILDELGSGFPAAPDATAWGVWAAEPPSPKVMARHTAGGWLLSGRKPWCSGAGAVSHALVTGDAPDGPRLFAVKIGKPAVTPADDAWPVPTLSGSDTRSVDFADAPAIPIGGPDEYVHRPGFWYGAVGVAAVWYGGAAGVAHRLEQAARQRDLGDIGSMHLGAVTAVLAGAHATLRVAAQTIDAGDADKAPRAEIVARSARAVVESAAASVIDHVGRALGPGPLAHDSEHARRVSDLRLYLRQSHADRDLAELGRRVSDEGGTA